MIIYPNKEQITKHLQQGDYRTVPVSLAMECVKESEDIYLILKNISHHVFLLESAENNKKHGRYTFLGYDPKLEITCKDFKVNIKSSTTVTFQETEPYSFIRNVIKENKSPIIPDLPTFTGGLVGYFSYDFIKYSEPELNLDAEDEEGFNDIDVMLFDKVIAIDHQEHKIILIVNIHTDHLDENYNRAVIELQQMKQLIEQGTPKNEQDGRLLKPLSPLFKKEQYCKMVEQAMHHIYEGDIFQVVLSNRFSAPYEGSLYSTYQSLCKSNPSPYMFYFSSDDIEIAGASPETLVKLEGDTVCTFPLAGTRPRGKTPTEDLQLEKELLTDEKECSEHNMLVDLGRNDIGRISQFGTVNVNKYMSIERFSHVMHIGSAVTGTIRPELDVLDALTAILPAGTLSGAPKLKACEIINTLEQNKRGIYGGAIGYLDFNGNIDTCIAIRLAFKKNGKVFVRSGAGIVADSVPEREYDECLNKAKAVINALEVTK